MAKLEDLRDYDPWKPRKLELCGREKAARKRQREREAEKAFMAMTAALRGLECTNSPTSTGGTDKGEKANSARSQPAAS